MNMKYPVRSIERGSVVYRRACADMRGVTLMEFLVYIAIISGVALAFVTFSLAILNTKSKTYVVQEVYANERIALDIMTRKIRAATSIMISSSTFDIDPGVLVFHTDASSTDPTIIDLSADNGSLRITEGTSSPVLITSDQVYVTNLQFTNLTASSTYENVRIELTMAYASSSLLTTAQVSARTAVSLRN